MDNRLSDVAPRVASACARFWSAVKSAWPTPMLDRSDRYRPEAHYMRGPGPKWRAKHDLSAHGFGQTRAG